MSDIVSETMTDVSSAAPRTMFSSHNTGAHYLYSKLAIVSDPGMPVEIAHEEEETSSQIPSQGFTALASGRAPSASGLYEYLVYKPSSGSTPRVWSGRKTNFSYPGDEAMYSCVNRYLEAIKWVQLMSWKNDTSAAQSYAYSYTTGMNITHGKEINEGFNLGASYEGMSMGYEHSEKTFKTTETTSSKTKTITVNVPAHSLVVFYQRRFDFRDEVTFICDAWGQYWNIGPWGGYTPLVQKNTQVQIMAEEYFTSSKKLPSGPGSVTTSYVSRARLADTTRKRENVTQRSKNMLVKMGL
ncbi:hypothetical protein CVT24_011934 [Panaeolus cyanescens]|uniref:Uncharacterized protein n=1 Tax=Panaeolus cyanescens TaxID=181874 RepID=A0A409VXN7_9AGAR|nr:hypothetical protein CVT24_011934 [Panaeolus cyanescens]